MATDMSGLCGIGDLVNVLLKKPLHPQCVGSETALREDSTNQIHATNVFGTYVGWRPGLVKVNPVDRSLLDAPEGISRYVVIEKKQIKAIYLYGKPNKVYP